MDLSVNRITNANIYVDGVGLLGRAEEIEVAQPRHLMIDHKGLGMAGVAEFWAGVAKLESRIKWTSIYPEVELLASSPFSSHSFQVMGSIEQYTSQGLSAELPLVYLMTGVFKDAGAFTFKPHENVDSVFARVTQKQESDLAFLKRLATSNGYDFTVRGTELVFYARSALEAQPPVLTVARGNVERFAFENRTRLVNKAAQVAYQDPASRQLIIQSVAATDIPTGDTCKLTTRCENGQQAMLKAQAALNNGNVWFTNARLTLPGSTSLSAGNTIALSGWASFDGVYLIDTSKHSLSRRTGYSTEVVMYRVS